MIIKTKIVIDVVCEYEKINVAERNVMSSYINDKMKSWVDGWRQEINSSIFNSKIDSIVVRDTCSDINTCITDDDDDRPVKYWCVDVRDTRNQHQKFRSIKEMIMNDWQSGDRLILYSSEATIYYNKQDAAIGFYKYSDRGSLYSNVYSCLAAMKDDTVKRNGKPFISILFSLLPVVPEIVSFFDRVIDEQNEQ